MVKFPEYFKQVQSDIKESVELAFKENIDRLDPTDVFTLVLFKVNKMVMANL